MSKEEKERQVQDQVEGYARKIVEEIKTNWIPGAGMSAMALELTDDETDQMMVAILDKTRDGLRDLRREIVTEAREDGRSVRFPTFPS